MFRKLALIGAISALSFAMVGCDDDDDAPAVAPPSGLTGTAAVGAPLANAAVVARCTPSSDTVDADEITTTTDASGKYTITKAQLTAANAQVPCALRVTRTTPAPVVTLYSVGKAEGVVNVTPLTDLIFARAVQVGEAGHTPADLFDNAIVNTLDVDAIVAAVDAAAADLQAELNAANPGAITFNVFTTPFTADGSSLYDRVLDGIYNVSGTYSYANLLAAFITGGNLPAGFDFEIPAIPVTPPAGTCVATGTQGGTLTVSGSYSSAFTGTIAIPAQSSSFTGAAPCAAAMASIYGGAYAGLAGYTITTLTNTATNHTYRASFQYGGLVNYQVTYSYVMNAAQ